MLLNIDKKNNNTELKFSKLERPTVCWPSLNSYINQIDNSSIISIRKKVLEVWYETIPSNNPGIYILVNSEGSYNSEKIIISDDKDVSAVHVDSFNDSALIIAQMYSDALYNLYKWYCINFSSSLITSGSFIATKDSEIKSVFLNKSTFVILQETAALKYSIKNKNYIVTYTSKNCLAPKLFSIVYYGTENGYATFVEEGKWFIAKVDNIGCISNRQPLPSPAIFYKVSSLGTQRIPYLYGVDIEKKILSLYPDPLGKYSFSIILNPSQNGAIAALFNHASGVITLLQIDNSHSSTSYYRMQNGVTQLISSINKTGAKQIPIFNMPETSPFVDHLILWKDVSANNVVIKGTVLKTVQYMLWSRLGNALAPGMFPEAFFVRGPDKSLSVSFNHPYQNVAPIECPDAIIAKFEATIALIAMPVKKDSYFCYPSSHDQEKVSIFYYDFEVQAKYYIDNDPYEQVRTLKSWDEAGEWIALRPTPLSQAYSTKMAFQINKYYQEFYAQDREIFWNIIDGVVCASISNNWQAEYVEHEKEQKENIENLATAMRMVLENRFELIGESTNGIDNI